MAPLKHPAISPDYTRVSPMHPDAATRWRGPRWTLAVLLACLGMIGPFAIDTYLPAFTGIAASLGMIAGLGITFYYMVTTQPWLRGVFGVTDPIVLWWGIQPISAGLFGVPVGFATIIIVSLLTPPPKKETQELVEHVRYPDLNLGKA